MRKLFSYLFFFLSFLISCRNTEEKNTTEKTIQSGEKIILVDSVSNISQNIETASKNSNPDIGLPLSATQNPVTDDIEVKIFQNENMNGFGYDIYMNGRVYIHQPNVPAKAGNLGFKNKGLAEKVGELAVYKIRHNILPPTINLEELDSLGVK